MLICPECEAERGPGGRCPGCGSEPATVGGFEAWAPETAHAGDGFDPERFAFLSRVQDDNFWFRGRSELLAWALDRYLPEARTLLEVGCGSGAVLDHLARHCAGLESLVGSDAHVEGLRFAAERVADRARLIQVDARRLPFREEFDAVGCFDVIEHVEDDAGALAGLRRALRPGGGLMLTVPQHHWLWSHHDEVARHVRRYAAGELRARVVSAGFRVVLETSFVSLLLPALLASRMLERFRPRPETEGLELRGLTNRAFYGAMRLERALVAAGVRFPVGGSRLLVARRE